MTKRLVAAIFVLFSTVQAYAQELSWIQVEAHPTLSEAQEAVRGYAATRQDVNGFYLGANWYGVAFGPYTAEDAARLLRELRRDGVIPRDAFVSNGERYGQQYWPIGVGAATTPITLPDSEEATTEEAPVVEVPVEEPVAEAPVIEPVETTLPDETVEEARASEGLLSRPEREMLQVMLKWAGFYNSSIDGAFGRGTRSSMAAWQQAKGYEATGILTTAQRAALLADYNAILDGVDLQLVRDDASGIQIQIPTGLVGEPTYESPFARFGEKDGSGVQVLLISQQGDRTRLGGLYEILQTLEIVPTEGERSRDGDSFVINGANSKIETYVTASTDGYLIKGFALVWPAGDTERRTRVLDNMIASFETVDGVLDAALVAEDQGIDLVSGLAIRKAQIARSGFYVDNAGTVVTDAATVAQCERVTIDDTYDATVAYSGNGIAVLKPAQRLAPMGVAAIQTGTPRLQTSVAVGGYSYGGALHRPTLTFGKLADAADLSGNADMMRLTMTTLDGDIGGPVFDNGGAVIGMLTATTANAGQVLPADVSTAIDAAKVLEALAAAGINATTTDQVAFMPPETMTGLSADVTVLVSCW